MPPSHLISITMQISTFDNILDGIEALPPDDQIALLNILQRRLGDPRRSEIATNISQAKKDCQAGHVFRGTIDEAILELNR